MKKSHESLESIRKFQAVFLLAAAAGCTTAAVQPQSEPLAQTQRDIAAVQSTTVPFDAIKTQLELKAGISYLDFMIKHVKPGLDAYDKDLRDFAKQHPGQWSQFQSTFISAGKGVAVRIDKQNYFFNIGYNNGSGGEDDLKSGRSYGVGPTHRQSDPSDIFYLKELGHYLESEPDAADEFYRALMLILVNSDASGWGKLSVAGQMVATDFLAIYTAESDRHLMINLDPRRHPWEIDLAAATFVSILDVATGEIMQDGKLVRGGLEHWWAKGTKGSGIGETRRDRKALQKMIADYEHGTKKGAALIASIEAITGSNRDHDVIQSTFEFLNKAPKGPGAFNHKALTEAMVKYLMLIKEDASAIAKGK